MAFSCCTFVDHIHLLLNSRSKRSPELMLYCLILADSKKILILSYLILSYLILHQGLSEPEFYGDLVYKFKKIMGRTDFSDQF